MEGVLTIIAWITGLAFAATLLTGLYLFWAGSMAVGSANDRSLVEEGTTPGPTDGFFKLINRAFTIVFSNVAKGRYTAAQRRIASGLVLIVLSMAFMVAFIPAAISAAASGDGGEENEESPPASVPVGS